MSEPYEIKKAKINSLVMAFTNSGYKSSNRIGQIELFQFLSKLTNSGSFDHVLAEKLFQVLNLDHMSTMSVEDFINGYLQFEEDLRRNAEIFNIQLNREQEIYANLVEQCRRYKTEKLNAEGLCENAKVYGEITDIDVKRKLEGIKEIIIKVVYNDKSEELHFKIGDINSNEMLNKTFGFKPTSRKDHFEFIMKGVNDRNQVFDIGSKVFPLTDINSYEEYIVQIVVPEIDNEEQVAAYINAKIVLYWSDYKYYERLKKKAESRLKKLIAAANKATQYLKYIREIYGDLTRKKSDLIVDFNNEKLMQRRGGKLKVNFNNQREGESTGSNYLVEYNNLREVQKTVPARTELTKTVQNKTITEKKIIQPSILGTIETTRINQQQTLPYIQSVQEETVDTQTSVPYISKIQEATYEQSTTPYISNVQKTTYQVNTVPYISNVQETQNVEYVNTYPEGQGNYSYQTQTQTYNNVIENGSSGYDMSAYNANNAGLVTTTETVESNAMASQDNGMRLAETVGYGSSDTMGNVEAYGTGGLEYIDDNQGQFTTMGNTQITNQTVYNSTFNESNKNPLITTTTLPVKVLEAKVNKPIVAQNVNTLPVIYNQDSNFNMTQSSPEVQSYSYKETVVTSSQ